MGGEVLCRGRPASGEKYLLGKCHHRFAIGRDDTQIKIEATRIRGAASVVYKKWGSQGATVVGICLAVGG